MKLKQIYNINTLILSYGDVAIEDVLQVLAGWSG